NRSPDSRSPITKTDPLGPAGQQPWNRNWLPVRVSPLRHPWSTCTAPAPRGPRGTAALEQELAARAGESARRPVEHFHGPRVGDARERHQRLQQILAGDSDGEVRAGK